MPDFRPKVNEYSEDDEFEDRLRNLEQSTLVHDDHLKRISDLESELAVMKILMNELITRVPAVLAEGHIPSLSSVSRMECQIWHTPGLTEAQKKGKSEWSLRVTIYIHGKRAEPELNIRTFPGDRFYRLVRYENLPPMLEAKATQHQSSPDIYLGRVQAKTDGKGTPYVDDQFVVMSDHLGDKTPSISIYVGNDVAHFDAFVPSKGKLATRSKWYCNWHNTKSYTKF